MSQCRVRPDHFNRQCRQHSQVQQQAGQTRGRGVSKQCCWLGTQPELFTSALPCLPQRWLSGCRQHKRRPDRLRVPMWLHHVSQQAGCSHHLELCLSACRLHLAQSSATGLGAINQPLALHDTDGPISSRLHNTGRCKALNMMQLC